MSRKHAFTLIESLLALALSMFVILSFGMLLKGLVKMTVPQNNNDLVQAIISLTEEVNLANRVEIENGKLRLYESSGESIFYLNDGRLVKTPGFDIYLHHLDELGFKTDGLYLYIYLKRGDNDGWFNIGAYVRAQKGICEPNCADGDEFSDVSDYPDDNNDSPRT